MVNEEGARLNVREAYHLPNYVAAHVKRVTWLMKPDDPENDEFLRMLRPILDAQSGPTSTSIGFLGADRSVAVADISTALDWKLSGEVFQLLRQHPAVAGVQIEASPLELKETRRWGKKR
jgi:DNA polymerase-3 subunit alpha